MRRHPIVLFVVGLVACGDGASSSNGVPIDDTVGADVAAADGTDSGVADAVDTSGPDSASDIGGDTTAEDLYMAHCESFFAVRIVELQVAADATFATDCDVPLTADIGRLRPGGKPLCTAGETANDCRTRHYRTPPDMDDLDQTCWKGAGPSGCMHASSVPRCADGSDTCVEDEAVCQDGTRPVVFAEAATAGPTNDWLFHLGGEGGPCAGATCWFNYRFGEAEFATAMSTLHPDSPGNAALGGKGIFNGDTSLPYSKLNRVRFDRCTDAASDAMELEAPVSNGVPAELAATYPDLPIATAIGHAPVWYRGLATWRATFHHMTTLEGRDRDGDGTPEMPSLADARLIIISASSDASMWVTLAADRLAAELRSIAGQDVEVRMMVDGMFPPMLDNEARYHANVPANFDMVSTSYAESGLCLLPDNGDGVANESCSAASYSAGGDLRSSYETRAVQLDASCEAMHGAGAPECYDRNHTLVHHLDMPVLILADQEDNTVSDGPGTYADDKSYFWKDPSPYRQRVVDQAWDLVDFWSTEAREEGAGTPGDLVLILPKTRREGENWFKATHVRFHDDVDMANEMTLCESDGTKVATASFNQMIGAWIADTLPQTFAIEDARRVLPNGRVWVTGGACRKPE
ncbi:MAG: hypothetical protein IV100_18800 [Myxococcales bacterium]|nr:hypothetical protein [Myxococcales bacterium]